MPKLETHPTYQYLREMTRVGPETMESWTRALVGLWNTFKEATAGSPMGSLLQAMGVDMPKKTLKLEQEVLDAATAAGILKPYAMGRFAIRALQDVGLQRRYANLAAEGDLTAKNLPILMRELFLMPQAEYSRIKQLIAHTGLTDVTGNVGQYNTKTSRIRIDPAYAGRNVVPHEFTHARQYSPNVVREEAKEALALRRLDEFYNWGYGKSPVEIHARAVAADVGARPQRTGGDFEQAYLNQLRHLVHDVGRSVDPEILRRTWQGVLEDLSKQLSTKGRTQ
uniref:Uncharacterized protein n=1 Tax=viral metagenome TaxID=1070528 RepID=A0A6M3IJE7_9ZZZZ